MDVRSWIRVGIVAGIVTIFLALVGLIGRFVDLNLVGEQVTFARLVLIAAPLVAGYAVTRPRIRAGERRALAPRDAIVAGAVSGATAGLVFGIAVVAADAFGIDRIRSVFLNVSEPLIDFVTFGQPPVVGAVITTAVSAVLVLGFLQRIIPIALDQLDLERDWLYSRSIGGLTWLGAIAVAATAAGLSVLNARKGRELRARLFSAGEEKTGVAPAQLVFVLVLVVVLVAVPWVVGE